MNKFVKYFLLFYSIFKTQNYVYGEIQIRHLLTTIGLPNLARPIQNTVSICKYIFIS